MSLRFRIFPILCVLLLSFVATIGQAQIVAIDGTTSTGITTDVFGHITIGVAPTGGTGISYNAFEQFSVPVAGVDLNNVTVGAHTIVNEVMSLSPTTINGALTVLGPSANVIIANPNGISVNGASFSNIGNLALTTGAIGRDAQNRVTSTVLTGSISIGSLGLAATVEELDLIARAISVNGTIESISGGTIDQINLMAGEAAVNFDPARGSGGIIPWAFYSNRGAAQSNAVVVSLGANAVLSAGSISITVTDEGAGVQMAGQNLAGAGGFRLTSSGLLEIENGSTTSLGAVNITASKIALSPDAAVEISSADSGVVLEARIGDVNLGQAHVSGATIAANNLASVGGVTVIAQGNILGSLGQGNEVKLSSSDHTVALFADGLIKFDGLVVNTLLDFRLSAGGDIGLSFVSGNIAGDLRVISSGNVQLDQSQLEIGSDIRLEGVRLQFGLADTSQTRTELTAVTGGLVLNAGTGGIVNYGGLLQGYLRDASDPEARGGLTILSQGDFHQRSLSSDHLAVSFSEFDDLYINVDGNVINETGRLFSNTNIFITAEGDVINDTYRVGDTHELQIVSQQGNRYWQSLFLKQASVTSTSAEYGDRLVENEVAFILAVGDVTITAQNIVNSGAEIKGADIVLTATDSVANYLGLAGGFEFVRECKLFCKVRGHSDLTFFSGNIEASAGLTINAGVKIENYAGAILSENDINFTSPITRFTPLAFGSLVERPSGLFGWATGAQYWMQLDRIDGFIGSSAGQIYIDGDLQLNNARGFDGQFPIVSGNEIVPDEFAFPAQIGRKPIGWLWAIF